MLITGSCLCGRVRYAVEGPLADAGNCHCSMCRKGHGTEYATYAMVDPERFAWTSGEKLVSAYESSANEFRLFCCRCGSVLGSSEGRRVGQITLGTVDADPGIAPRSHIFVASKAAWCEIDGALPQFPEWPPGEGWS